MTTVTAQELALLRTRPHTTKLWLSIYQPDMVYAGQVSSGTSKGSMDIPVINASGTSANICSGMTMYVGTTWNGFDKGKIRVRGISGSMVSVAENSHINWANGDYVTIVDFFEIWPVFPRIIQDPADATKTIWYKDWDIPYTNQNSVLGYFINMGGHYAGFKNDPVYYTAFATVPLRSDETGTSYHWQFEGGTPSSSTSSVPGYVTYSTPGHYTTRLTVSGSVTGATDVSYRHISIYDRVGEGVNTPTLKWELIDLSGNRDQGGYTASLRVFETIPESKLRDGSLVVIFAEDWYGDTKQSIGSLNPNRQKIFFIGYVIAGTIRYNYRDSYVDFSIGSPTEIMKTAEGFSVSIQDSDDPANDAATNPDIPSGWVALLNMSVKKAIYHYLRWHSTVFYCCDFIYTGTDRLIQYFDADRTSIYDAINTVISSAIVGRISGDRQCRIYSEIDIYLEPGSYGIGFTLNNQDWMGDPVIEERPIPEISYLEMGGIHYDGSTFEALMAAAPGTAPGYRGKIQRVQGLALTGQNQLNAITGLVYSQSNAKYPNVEMHIAGNYRNFDIAPQEQILLTLLPTDTIRGITFNQKAFFINSISWEYNAEDESLLPILSLEEVTSGTAADSIPIPDLPPIAGDDGGGFVIPPITIPPFEIPPFPVFPGQVMQNFVPAISGFSPGLLPANFQTVGFYLPNYVIYFFAGNAGVGYGHTKAQSTSAGTLSVYTVLEGFAAGNVSVEVQIFNVTQATSVTSGVQVVTLIDGINFILPLSVAYNANDVLSFVINYGASSAVDAGIVGWSIS